MKIVKCIKELKIKKIFIHKNIKLQAGDLDEVIQPLGNWSTIKML